MLLNARIANNAGMIEYCQNQIVIKKELLLVELNKLGAGDKLDVLTNGADSPGQLLAGAQLVNGQYQYSGSQIRELLNSGQATSNLRGVGGSFEQSVTISVTNGYGQTGALVLRYVRPGLLWGGDYYTVSGVDWSGADSRTISQQLVFDPAERVNSNALMGRAIGTLQVAGAVVEGGIGIGAAPATGGASLLLTLHAVDQGYAGLVAVVTGQGQSTVTYTVTKATAQKAGMSEDSAGWLAFGVDNGISLGADIAAAGKLLKAGRAAGAADDVGEAVAKNFDQLNVLAKQANGHGFGLEILNNTCFVAGTPLLTPDGARPIEEFQPGDEILSRSELHPDGEVVVRRVEKIFRLTGLVAELTIGGRLIETTAEHPFYVPGKGWRRTHELEPGDHLVGHDGKLTAVDSVVLTVRTAAVYNLRVATDHTYFVGDPNWGFTIWAHNAYSVRQIDDATWGVWDDIKNAFVKNGDNAASYAAPEAAKLAADAGNDAIKAAIEAAVDNIAPPKVHMGRQGKHIPGHNNYQPGKSILTADPLELARQAGTGRSLRDIPIGQPGSREIIDFGTVIGQHVDEVTGTATQTAWGVITYGKDGIHIFPVRPQ